MLDNDEGSYIHSEDGKGRPSSFEFDDAFADGEDQNEFPEFSPDIIREEMAKIHSGIEERWLGADDEPELPHTNGLHDISVSTLALEEPPPADARSVSPTEPSPVEPEDGFSRVSLSGESVDDGIPDTFVPYPNVIIDASNPIADCVETTPPRSKSPNLQINPPSPDHEEDPPSSLHSAPNPASDPSENENISSLSTPPSSAPAPPPHFKRHQASRSAGPSAFEKVMSKTRPTFLPPKSRQEDNKHLADWQAMMKQSRAAGGLYCVGSFLVLDVLTCFV
jgi:hypothetical protein